MPPYRRPVLLPVVLIGALTLALSPLALGARKTLPAAIARADQRATQDLCTLVAVPGDAFTFVAPPAPPPGASQGLNVITSVINVTYVGFEPFPTAQAAFQAAVDIWSQTISSPVPIAVRAEFKPLASNVLGSAGGSLRRDFAGAPVPGTWYIDALADQLRGADNAPGGYDISANFNSTFASWYFGTDGATPAGQWDFMSVVLHELGHGLGFFGTASVSSGTGAFGINGYPLIYDRWTVTETGAPMLGFVNPSTALGTQLTQGYSAQNPRGPGAYWAGPRGMLGNGGLTARLYTPSTWTPGSSFSHLDENAFPAGNANSLMTPAMSSAEAIHSPGSIVGGVFADMGWSNIATNAPTNIGRDFNADGKPDLLFESTSGQLYAWFMNGTTFAGGSWLSPSQIDANWRVVGTNDFTGDGTADLLLQQQLTGAVTIFRMSGLTKVSEQALPIGANTPWKIVATGDFNGDTEPDIAWQNATTGQVYVWMMKAANGNAGYAGVNGAFIGDFVRNADSSIAAFGATSLRVAGAADINLDGHPDLVWQDDTTGNVGVWYLNGLTRTASAPLSPGQVNPVWKIRSVGDYNADGRADLIWQNTATGDLFAWILNGANLTTAGFLAPSGVNPAWTIVGPR